MKTRSISQILKKRQNENAVIGHAQSARMCTECNTLLQEMAPEHYEDGVRATSFKRGILIIKVNNYAQAQHFYFQAYAWKEVLNEKMGKEVVREIKIRQYN